ncbi:MAG: DJ-1/PfpI family protein [Chitinophagales bacterium]
MTHFVFILLPEVHLMDLAGPEQVLLEAIDAGAPFTIAHAVLKDSGCTSSGIPILQLPHYKSIQLQEGDYLIIPGPRIRYLESEEFMSQTRFFDWIRRQYDKGVNVCSICSGAYALAHAGILRGRRCTTHWKKTKELQRRFPSLQVQENVLFTHDGNLYTSAGIASGVDMALYIVEQLMGPFFAHRVAREMVIYNRRGQHHPQQSEFFDYRNHIHSGIHKVQDWLHDNLRKRINLDELARMANMSTRNFTRIFKRETGVTVNEYITTLRKERIQELLNRPDLSRHQIAAHCGLRSERQVSRLISAMSHLN